MTHYPEHSSTVSLAKENAKPNRRRFFQYSLKTVMGVVLGTALATKAALNWREPEKERLREMWEGMRDEQVRLAKEQYERALRAKNPLNELRSLHATMQGRPSANEVQESPVSFADIQIAPADIQQILAREWSQLKEREENAPPDAREQITATLREYEDVARLFSLPVNPIPKTRDGYQ